MLVPFDEMGQSGWYVLRAELEPKVSGLPGLFSLLLSVDGEAPSMDNSDYRDHCLLLIFL